MEARIAPATFVVTTLRDISNADHTTGSLRDAIALADADGGSDSIVFKTAAGHPLTGTIKLLSDLPAITDGVTITGPTNAATGLTINGNGHEIFTISSTTGDVSLSNLTVTHGLAANGGGIYINDNGKNVTITNVNVTANQAIGANGVSDGTNGAPGTARGGGLFIHSSSSGTVTIVSSTISGNTATGGHADTKANAAGMTYAGGNAKGGGIYTAGYSLVLQNTIVSGNIATGGKGGKQAGTSTFAGAGDYGGNAYGGGIYHGGAGELSLIQGTKEVQIIKNSAVGGAAGGIGGGGGAAVGGGIDDAAARTGGPALSIQKSLISGNTASAAASGAAVYYSGASNSTTYAGPAGKAAGGGVTVAGYATIQSSTISKNKAQGGHSAGQSDGGAAIGGGVYASGKLNLTSTTVSGNTAVGGAGGVGIAGSEANSGAGSYGGAGGKASGGGIALSGSQAFTIQSSTISGNTAQAGAGGAGGAGVPGTPGTNAIGNGPDATGAGPGYAGGYGGNAGGGGDARGAGVYLADPTGGNAAGHLTLVASTISGNIGHAGQGGAGGKGGNGGAGGAGAGSYPAQAGGNGGNGGDAANGGGASGGGIYAGGGSTLTVQKSTISGNTVTIGLAGAAGAAGRAGSGVYRNMGMVYHGYAGAAGSAADEGTARGGGILSSAGSISLSQVTIAKNTAGQGGGVDLEQDTAAAIHNSTIAENTAHTGGGMFVALDGANDPVHVVSTIVAMNSTTKGGTGPDIMGTIDVDHDLIQVIAGVTFTDTDPDTITGKSPLLGALGLHGGTTEVLVPGAASPVINAGVNPDSLTTDQRGDPIEGTIDIGSVEVG